MKNRDRIHFLYIAILFCVLILGAYVKKENKTVDGKGVDLVGVVENDSMYIMDTLNFVNE